MTFPLAKHIEHSLEQEHNSRLFTRRIQLSIAHTVRHLTKEGLTLIEFIDLFKSIDGMKVHLNAGLIQTDFNTTIIDYPDRRVNVERIRQWFTIFAGVAEEKPEKIIFHDNEVTDTGNFIPINIRGLGIIGYLEHPAFEALSKFPRLKENLELGLSPLLSQAELEGATRQFYLQGHFDALTKRMNRREFSKLLSLKLLQVTKSEEAQNQSFAVAICDIDHFKKFNDTYGHAMGDYVLTLIPKFATEAEIQTHQIARTGGEEFSFLFDSLEEAKEKMENFRRVIAEKSPDYLRDRGVTEPLNISAGITEIHGNNIRPEDHDNPMALLDTADAALYVAKGKGEALKDIPEGCIVTPMGGRVYDRNKVVVYSVEVQEVRNRQEQERKRQATIERRRGR